MRVFRVGLFLALVAALASSSMAQSPTENELKDRVKALETQVAAMKKEIEQLKAALQDKGVNPSETGGAPEKGHKTSFNDTEVVLSQVIRSGTQVKFILFATEQKADYSFTIKTVETVDQDGVTRKTDFKLDLLKLRKDIRTRFELTVKDIPTSVKSFSAVEFQGRNESFTQLTFSFKDVKIPGK